MNIELVTIGDELLLGFTLDSNGAHLARELAAVGVTIVRRTSVGDDAAAIGAAVREALDRTGAVITTGGLGPTADDMTKEGIAAIFGRAMKMDDAILDALRERWRAKGWGKELPESNRRQALIPEGATILTNRHGSAPGIWLQDDRGRWVAMLPGVPREMRGMFEDELLPRVRARVVSAASLAAAGMAAPGETLRAAPSLPVVLSRTIRTTGIAESAIADALGVLAGGFDGVSLAYLPGWEGVDLRLTVRDRPAPEAAAALDAASARVRSPISAYVYGKDHDDLAALVLERCRAKKLTIAVAESCTGGMLGARITAIPGSSGTFLGGVLAYANAVKETHLGVRSATLEAHGAVSEETAREMASGVRTRLSAGAGVAITGIAGPDGGSAEKPVGTVCLAVDVAGEVRSFRRVMVGDRDEIRHRAAQSALDLLRRSLA